MMKKVMLFLMISSSYYGCTDHDLFPNEPESGVPAIGYSVIDSVLAYNKHVPLDLDSDGKPDIYFTSVLINENEESCLYLQARAVGGSGTRILTAKHPQLVGNGRWALPLTKGTLIGDETGPNVIWDDPAQNAALLKIVENSPVPAFSGPWVGKADHYLAFRKVTNGHEQFGWVRLSHQAGTQNVKIHDVGVNLMSGAAIAAGKFNR